MFKKTQISHNVLNALAFITISVLGGGITNPVSAETITLENQQISRTRGSEGSRYATEFNHPDQDLVIHWQNNDSLPPDGNPIRDGNVNVRNLTIDANFFEDINDSDPNPQNHYYLEIRNKGVYANSGLTHIHASDTIQIKAKNDGIYTESNGSVLIDGFKKLDVQGLGYASIDVFARMDPNFPREEWPSAYTTGAHGIVDNGEGISIHGGSGSEVNIVSNGFAVMNGIGNRLGVYSTDPRHPENSAVGRGIDITTDKLTVQSRGNAIGAATGKEGQQFKVSVESAEMKLKGGFNSVLAGGNALIEINQHTQGLVQLTGTVTAVNQGQVRINFDKDGSYLDDGRPSDRSDEIIAVGGLREREHDNADIGHAVLNFRGNDQYIKGYSRIQGERALLELTSTGANFSAKTKTGGTYDNPLFFVEQGGTLKLNASGDNATFVGELKAQEASLLDMSVSGQGARLQGDITTSEKTPGAHIKTLFSGDNAQVEGNIIAKAEESTIELTFRGDNSSLKGSVSSFGSSGSSGRGYDSYKDNVIRLESTGAGMTFEGELKAHRENTLTANFSGEGAELKASNNGKLITNSGTLSLIVDNHGTLTGNMDNFAERIQRGRQGQQGYEDYMAKGDLAVTLANATSYSGNVGNRAGTVALTLKESEWFGNLTTASEAEDTHVALEKSLWRGDMTAAPEAQRTRVTLTRESTWKGAATGSGMVELSGQSTWKATANSQLDTLTMDATSVTSLEGDAQRLTTQTLNGSGTFVLDLTYQNDAIETYRDGTASDFIVVTNEGDNGTHRVALTETTNLETMPTDGKLYFAVAPEGKVTFETTSEVLVPNPHRLFNKIQHYQVKSEPAQTNTSEAENTDEAPSTSERRVSRDVAPSLQNWYLTYTGSEEVVNDNALTAPDIYTATVALWRDNDTLLKRLGDLHALHAGTGSWARLIARKLDHSGEHAFESKLNTVQLGIDRSRLDERGTWYFGLAYAYHDGKSTVNTGSSDVDGHELTLYASRADSERRHLDLVARLGRFGTRYDSFTGDKGSFHNLAASVSAEVGWVLPLGATWQIEPQAQLTYSTVWGDTFDTHYGIKVEQDNAKSLVGRLGVVLAREFAPSGDNAGRVYAKASVLHDFLGKTRSTLTDGVSYVAEDTLRDTWGVLGIGTTWSHGEHLHLYLDAETSVGASVRMNYNLNAGLRYTF